MRKVWKRNAIQCWSIDNEMNEETPRSKYILNLNDMIFPRDAVLVLIHSKLFMNLWPHWYDLKLTYDWTQMTQYIYIFEFIVRYDGQNPYRHGSMNHLHKYDLGLDIITLRKHIRSTDYLWLSSLSWLKLKLTYYTYLLCT